RARRRERPISPRERSSQWTGIRRIGNKIRSTLCGRHALRIAVEGRVAQTLVIIALNAEQCRQYSLAFLRPRSIAPNARAARMMSRTRSTGYLHAQSAFFNARGFPRLWSGLQLLQ